MKSVPSDSDALDTPDAPGAPGSLPTWTSSAKQMVGCALGGSRLWFTTGFGIVNEVYHPRVDSPQVRDLGFIVADGKGFWIEVKRLGRCEVRPTEPGVPVFHAVHRHERFTLSVRVTPDPERDVLLIEVVLEGDPDLRTYALLAPHVGGTGHVNRAATGTYHGRTVLWADHGPHGVALAAADEAQSDAFLRTSAGYVGASDGWQDFSRNGAMTWTHRRAGPGNVSLTGELPRRAVLALGLADTKEAAATLAFSALAEPFDRIWDHQVADWLAWHDRCRAGCATAGDVPGVVAAAFRTSAMVLRVHQDKTYPGAMVASLSVPWGNTHDARGGYHLVWPRDLVECAGGLLALGGDHEARNTLRYLVATQQRDGRWNQNQWLDGTPYWRGIQLDQAAFPVLLAAALAERGALAGIGVRDMTQRALSFIATNGPASDQDRWEENEGVNTFTLAVCVAALVAGADWLEPSARTTALALADFWNAHIEEWTAVRGTALARRLGVPGYYVRTAPIDTLDEGDEALRRLLPIKNRLADAGLPADEQVATDFLQLVRFGLRRADDPLVVASVKVADALLRADTPSGPAWHRYNGDGYGEHDDGTAYDGTGTGRPWPLLTGERGHYEVAAGRDALPYLQAMVAMSSETGLIPEQVWNAVAIPEHSLAPGRPTGSAMPLAWAHAEFVKLVRSREIGRPYDRPEAVWKRYGGERPVAGAAFWCEHAPIQAVATGTRLLVGLRHQGIVHWGTGGWQDVRDTATRPSGLGLHLVEIPTDRYAAGTVVDLTWRDGGTGKWAGRDFHVAVQEVTS